MAKSKNEKPKEEKVKTSTIQVEQVGSPSTPEVQSEQPQVQRSEVDPDKDLFDLQKEVIALGMPKEDAGKFKDVALLNATINTLKAVKASATVNIVEPVNPREDSRIEKQWRTKAQRMKDYFDAQPKVSIIVPCEAKEKPGTIIIRDDGKQVFVGAWWSKTFNGYRVDVPKGVYTSVPKDVADNISAEYNQVQADLARLGIDRIDPKTGKPVADRL